MCTCYSFIMTSLQDLVIFDVESCDSGSGFQKIGQGCVTKVDDGPLNYLFIVFTIDFYLHGSRG
jgi:hypothetical protein